MILDKIDGVVVGLVHVVLYRVEIGLDVVHECIDGLNQIVSLEIDHWGRDHMGLKSQAFDILLDEGGPTGLFVAPDPHGYHLRL